MVTMDLRNMNADAELAIRMIKYLRHFSILIPAMNSPILSVLSKWVDGNSIVDAHLHKSGDFYSLVKQNVQMGTRQSIQLASSDHTYLQSSIISFAEFNQEIEASKFEVKAYMNNFRPNSVDTEGLFSTSRTSKNYLQGRLTPENHHRNVYLRKNEHLLYEKFVQ